MRNYLIAAAAMAGLCWAGSASAQNYDADPNYGEVTLSAGFTPDPSLTSLLAGGSVDAAGKNSSCSGFISDAPDLRLFWDGSGKGAPNLKISAMSNADTTLVVVAYRKATIGLADEVVHLDDGRVAARGTHAELLASSPDYARLVNAYEQAALEDNPSRTGGGR